MNAMILAAGLGTRMAPLSDHIAKPALPILDEPLILRLARQVAAAGATRLVVNAHAHAETLRDALRDAPIPVEISLERELLGSGGGIGAARQLLAGEGPFLVLNGDMALDLDLASLVATHRRTRALVTLALRDDPRKLEFGTIGYDGAGRVRRITSRIDLGGESACGLFIGVHVIDPRILPRMPDGAFEILPALYVPALRDGEHLQAWIHPLESRWWPVGSPAELLDANLRALRELGASAQRVGSGARVDGELIEPVWIGPGAILEHGACAGPGAIIGGGARVPRGASLRDALVLGGKRAPAATLSRAIVYADGVFCNA